MFNVQYGERCTHFNIYLEINTLLFIVFCCYTTEIVDLLWSDPMPQNGCIPNEVRGGGCYWGPDVTEEVLGRHNLQLLIRSHECKQEGYEFCHNRMVSTKTYARERLKWDIWKQVLFALEWFSQETVI